MPIARQRDQHAGEQRVALQQHQRVERVAVLAEGVLDVAVVGRVLGRGEQRPVQPDPAGPWSTSYLLRLPGDLDQDVELHGMLLSCGSSAPGLRVRAGAMTLARQSAHRDEGRSARAPRLAWLMSAIVRRERSLPAPVRPRSAPCAATPPRAGPRGRGPRGRRRAPTARGSPPAACRAGGRGRRSPGRSRRRAGLGPRLLGRGPGRDAAAARCTTARARAPGRARVDREAAHRGRAARGARAHRPDHHDGRRGPAPRAVVLVGGGDPHAQRGAGRRRRPPIPMRRGSPTWPRRLRTAARRGRTRIVVDDSLFTGPASIAGLGRRGHPRATMPRRSPR